MSEFPRRKHIRFPPEPGIFAVVDTDISSDVFDPKFNALVVEYNPMSGCGLIFTGNISFSAGTKLRVKVGDLSPLTSEVIWIRLLEDNIFRCGMKFLE
jgi:hypothetical protein